MENVLKILKNLPEYESLCHLLEKNACVGMNGVSQLCRTHLMAALVKDFDRPVVFVTQDELSAQRLMGELHSFLAVSYTHLTLPTMAVV